MMMMSKQRQRYPCTSALVDILHLSFSLSLALSLPSPEHLPHPLYLSLDVVVPESDFFSTT